MKSYWPVNDMAIHRHETAMNINAVAAKTDENTLKFVQMSMTLDGVATSIAELALKSVKVQQKHLKQQQTSTTYQRTSMILQESFMK